MSDSERLTEEPDELLSSHNYDGIQEYDNPTPGWWNWLFIGSIVFSPLYIFWFHSPVAPHTLAAQYDEAYAQNLKLQFGEMEDHGSERANILHDMHDERWLAVGASIFATNCKSCHGGEGEGVSAPNMTDDYYINVKQVEDMVNVVTNGAKNGAMPAWVNRLTDKEIRVVAAYAASLRGKNLSSTRPAEGNEIPPWPESVEAGTSEQDSTPAGAGASAETSAA
jgi:cytochrome c oxidase cbb3-type subunit 3